MSFGILTATVAGRTPPIDSPARVISLIFKLLINCTIEFVKKS